MKSGVESSTFWNSSYVTGLRGVPSASRVRTIASRSLSMLSSCLSSAMVGYGWSQHHRNVELGSIRRKILVRGSDHVASTGVMSIFQRE
jgi:hypothetical protein